MLSKKVLEYLKKEPKLLPENQEKYRKLLENYNIKQNSDFYIFMSKYGGDMEGSLEYMMNVPEDLSQEDSGVSNLLHKNEEVPSNFISLFDYKYEDYLLYNKDDDSAVLILGGNINKLNNADYDRKWNSFNSFLEDFLNKVK